jgi:hypothetical protein
MFLCMCEGKKLYGSEWGEPSGRKKETNGNNGTELEPMNNWDKLSFWTIIIIYLTVDSHIFHPWEQILW